MGAHPEPPPQVRTRPRRPGRGLLSTSLYGNFHLPTVQGRVPPTRCALLSREPQDSPFRRVPTWKCWGQGKGGPSGESCKCGVWQGSPAGSAPSLRPGPAPPSVGLAGAESTYQGGFRRLAPLLATQLPGGMAPPPLGTDRKLSATRPPQSPQTDQEVAFADSSHLSRRLPQPPARPPTRRRAESAGFGPGSPPRSPRPPARAQPPPAGLRGAYLEAGTAAAHLPAAYCEPNSGRWPSCRALLCQRRSGRVAGAELRRGRTGGWLFLGGETRLIVWGGRAVCGLGRARCCTLGGERVSGNEVSCCIQDRGGQR